MRVLIFLVFLVSACTAERRAEPALSAFLSVQTALSSASSTSASTAGEALVTNPPVLGEDRVEVQEKWHLTTYYSCHTFDQTATFCGLHEPVLPGGTEIARAGGALNPRAAAIVAGVLAVGAAFR